MFDPLPFDTDGMSEPETASTWHLLRLLDDLNSFAADFEAAVRLMAHCQDLHRAALANDARDERQLFLQMFVPARDAAVTLYQYGWTLKTSIPDALRHCPTVMAKVNHETLRTIRREFADRFPNYHLLRHAVGHAAELSQTQQNINSNAAKERSGIGPAGFMRCNLFNKTLVYTISGKEVSVGVAPDSSGALWEFAKRTFDAFRPASRFASHDVSA